MESSNQEYDDSMKTPRRTTRKSSTQLGTPTQKKRITRKTVLPEIEEAENAIVNFDPVASSRSIIVLEPKTPSRDGLGVTQTPRRSVRKSIKPVQEYENIVAYKGLSAKRLASTSIEDDEQETEAKWAPAVIGRVSTKRSKKTRRAKKKQLQRQKKIEEVELSVDELKENNQLNSYDVKERTIADLHDVEAIAEENQLGNSKADIEDKPRDDKNSIDDRELSYHGDISNDKQDKEANIKGSAEITSCEVNKAERDEDDMSDDSMEGGDTEVATMPITADDCMEAPEALIQLSPPKNEYFIKRCSVPSTLDPVNKTDDSDCIMLSLSETSFTEHMDSGSVKITTADDCCDATENNMPPLLLCSDDEDDEVAIIAKRLEPKNDGAPPKEEKQQQNDKTEKKQSLENDQTTLLNSTFDKDESPIKNTEATVSGTPLFRPSISRIATPFKSSKAIILDFITEPQEDINLDNTPDVVIEPREITLKSSRKRSFSLCTDRPKKIVTFKSPANTTVSNNDTDFMEYDTTGDTLNVTQRRKRSLSVAETDKEMTAYFKQKKPGECTPDKRSKLPQPSSRTKMPNFAAIHQQQFRKMESISDHVVRKAERAKIISNSAAKVKPASIQKGLPVKNSVLREFNKNGAANKPTLMPRARTRIELSGLKIRSKSKPDLTTIDDMMPSIDKTPSKMNASTFVFMANTKPPKHLPKPKFDLTLNALKAPFNSATSNKLTTTATSKAKPSGANTTIATVSHLQLNMPDPRPKFNASTAIDCQASKTTDKLDDRRKRLMDMYKSRSQPRNGEKNREILKGVRTNRRFELQMMCRNRPN